jgi:hypothetical protein
VRSGPELPDGVEYCYGSEWDIHHQLSQYCTVPGVPHDPHIAHPPGVMRGHSIGPVILDEVQHDYAIVYETTPFRLTKFKEKFMKNKTDNRTKAQLKEALAQAEAGLLEANRKLEEREEREERETTNNYFGNPPREKIGSPLLRFQEIIEPSLFSDTLVGLQYEEFAVRADTITAVEPATCPIAWRMLDEKTTDDQLSKAYGLPANMIRAMMPQPKWEVTDDGVAVRIVTEDYADKLIKGTYEDILELIDQVR